MGPKIDPCKTPKNIFKESLKTESVLAADYMEIFNPSRNFNSVYQLEENLNHTKNFNSG